MEQAFRPALGGASAPEVLCDNSISGIHGSRHLFHHRFNLGKEIPVAIGADGKIVHYYNVLFSYQNQRKYRLHEFVVMPDHFHVLLTSVPPVTLEKSVQFIKGGFSYCARKELGLIGEPWQTSFYDHRVRDGDEYSRFRHYIHMNPVRRGLVPRPEEFPYSSAMLKLDEVPQWQSQPPRLSAMQGLKPCSTLFCRLGPDPGVERTFRARIPNLGGAGLQACMRGPHWIGL